MDGRSYPILATLALLGTALTGCIAPGLTQNSAETEVSALKALPGADAAAQSWAPGAKLLAVFALESAEDNEPIPADATPGNGLAPLWNFAYRSPDGATRAFLAFADGTVRTENETYGAEQYADQASTLDDLKVDSDVALETAALDETFGAALRGEGLTLAEGVADMDGVTGWYFAAISDDSAAIAVVDAVTGELLWSMPFEMPKMDFGMYAQRGFAYAPTHEPVHVEQEGKLDKSQPKVEVPFTLDGFGDEARITLGITKDLATDGVHWRLVKLGEDGEEEMEIESTSFGYYPTSHVEERTWDVELDGPGDYRLDLLYRSTAVLPLGHVDYKLVIDAGILPEEEEDEDDG